MEELVKSALGRARRQCQPEAAQAHICRRLIMDPAWRVRSRVRLLVERRGYREVALPLTPDGPWDATGWLRGKVGQPLFQHRQGERILQQHWLPVLKNLGELRELLGIKSPNQLGYLLLATDQHGGP